MTESNTGIAASATLGAPFDEIIKNLEARRRELDAFLATQPPSMRCERHPEQIRSLDAHASDAATRENGTLTAGYAQCAVCEAEKRFRAQNQQLREAGVPEVLLDATLDNWTPRTPEEESNLLKVRRFTEAGRGFLILLGEVGTGKSHLAVGAMRHFRHPFFAQQNRLLRLLRATYRGNNLLDPIEQAQKCGLFVLDELGVTAGGKDEFPMLHEILNHRYGEHKPTILTGNLAPTELREVLGERLADRLHEAAYALLRFLGPSHRADRRDIYLGGGEQ